MKKVIKFRYLPAMGIACLLGLATILTCTGQSGAQVGLPLAKVKMLELYGGLVGCESGCETTSDHCDSYDNPCGAALVDTACTRCTSDDQKEECKDWGICMTWPTNTCSKCEWDDEHDCGDIQDGACGPAACIIVLADTGNCGAVTKCHTNNP